MLAAGERQRVDDQPWIDRRHVEAGKLGIDEADIEAGIVSDQLGAVDEVEEILQDLGKDRLALEIGIGDAVNFLRVGMHRAPLRVDVFVEGAARGETIVQLDAADFDQAILTVVEAGRFGIENDLAQLLILSFLA